MVPRATCITPSPHTPHSAHIEVIQAVQIYTRPVLRRSVMGAIYVNDRNIPKTSLNDVWSYINSLAPAPPIGIIPENNGYKIQFNDETQCNFIFQQHVIWDL